MILRNSMRPIAPKRVVIAAAVATTFLIVMTALAFGLDRNNKFNPVTWRPSLIDSEPEPDHGAPRSKAHDFLMLGSLRNKMGFLNTISVEKTGYEIMNPTLLQLPKGSKHDFLVIARAFHVDKEIGDRKYRLARQVAFFAQLTYNRFGMPELTAEDEWSRLLVEDFAGPEHHCKHQPDMDKYIGPEDMKLFWTRTGAPLLIFTYQVNDENLCQGQFLIDARAAVPELEAELGDQAEKMAPIRFSEPVGLRRQAPEGQEAEPRYQREKNWAPTQSLFSKDAEELLFMVEPGQLYRWKAPDKPVEPIMDAETESAVEAPYPYDVEAEDTWHSVEKTCVHDVMLSDKHVHQSSPMLSVTLCKRGECEPSVNNTVMLGMVQRRYDRPGSPFTWYDRHIVVYNMASPYNMMSVSKSLAYYGEGTKYHWTGSMVYYRNENDDDEGYAINRSHGYLDDEIWLSFGIGDSAPGWLDVEARELITHHYFCQNATAAYKDYAKKV